MKVWVLMGNDFPDSVYATKKKAEAAVKQKRIADDRNVDHYPRIYWRYYELEVL
jgi:hypothetical protein